MSVVAGLVPATPMGRLVDRGGRDKPGHDTARR
jgi:hypothetical protein